MKRAATLCAVVLLAPLPLRARPVAFEEVSERVLRKVCWHSHAQPDYARGDGGPGNSGGFGWIPPVFAACLISRCTARIAVSAPWKISLSSSNGRLTSMATRFTPSKRGR